MNNNNTTIINDNIFKYLSDLSLLSFNEQEQVAIKNELNALLGFFAIIHSVALEKTDNDIIITHVNRFREDTIKKSLSRKEALAKTSQHNDEFFLVPKILDK